MEHDKIIEKYANEDINTLGAESLREYCNALIAKLEKTTRLEVEQFRKAQLLKNTINKIAETYSIDMGEIYKTLADSNGYDLDTLLYYLSKT